MRRARSSVRPGRGPCTSAGLPTRIVTPNAVSRAGSTRVRRSSVGLAIGARIVAEARAKRPDASVLVPSAPACGPDCRSSPVWWPVSRPRRWSSGGSSSSPRCRVLPRRAAPLPSASFALGPSPSASASASPRPRRPRARAVGRGTQLPRRARAPSASPRRRRPRRLSAAPGRPRRPPRRRAGPGAGLPSSTGRHRARSTSTSCHAVTGRPDMAGAATPEAVATPLPAVPGRDRRGAHRPGRCRTAAAARHRLRRHPRRRVARPCCRPHRAARPTGPRAARRHRLRAGRTGSPSRC